MHPHLFSLPFGLTAHAYGVLILLGGIVAVPFLRWDVRTRGIAPGHTTAFVVDFCLVVIAGAFVGGRVAHVLTVPGVYASDPARLVSTDGTGFVFFGSLMATAAGWAWLAMRYRVRVGSVWDMGLTWMGLAHACGRVGCAMAGCCWGGVHTGGGGIRFGAESIVARSGGAPIVGRSTRLETLPLHPTQFYEAAGLLLIFAVLGTTRARRGPEVPWRMASRYAVAYGCLRAGIEVFRGDASRGFVREISAPSIATALSLPPGHVLGVSISQALALALAGLGAWGLWRTR